MANEKVHASDTSYWPLVLAATLTVTMIGLLIGSLIVTAAFGVVSIIAMIGWGAERFLVPDGGHAGPQAAAPSPGRDVAAGEVTRQRATAWWGMVWFIATEATFFVLLISAYVYLRAVSATWPPPGTPHADLAFPIVNTVILLLSGVPAYLAERAIVKGNRSGLQLGIVLAAVLGAIFLGGQAFEYLSLINAGLTLQSSIFGAGFYILTGFHGLHVLAGITLLLVMLGLSIRGRFSAEQHFGVQFASTYWHFVDIVWIAVFTVLYLAR